MAAQPEVVFSVKINFAEKTRIISSDQTSQTLFLSPFSEMVSQTGSSIPVDDNPGVWTRII